MPRNRRFRSKFIASGSSVSCALFVVPLIAGGASSAVAATVLVCTNPSFSSAAPGQPVPGYMDLKMGTLEIDGSNINAKFYVRDVITPVLVDTFSNPIGSNTYAPEYFYTIDMNVDGNASTGCATGGVVSGLDYTLISRYLPPTGGSPHTASLAAILAKPELLGPFTQKTEGCRGPTTGTFGTVAVDTANGVVSLAGSIPSISAQTRYTLRISRFDGTTLQSMACSFGDPATGTGSGSAPGQDQFRISNGVIPPDAVTVTAGGTLSQLSLAADLRIDDLLLQPPAAASFSAGGYNVYVAANSPGGPWFQKVKSGSWGSLTSPLGIFMENQQVSSADQRVRVEILRDLDVSQLRGTEIYIGYGTSDSEMLANRRYRGIYKIPAAGTTP